jgi:hypothetical protein
MFARFNNPSVCPGLPGSELGQCFEVYQDIIFEFVYACFKKENLMGSGCFAAAFFGSVNPEEIKKECKNKKRVYSFKSKITRFRFKWQSLLNAL